MVKVDDKKKLLEKFKSITTRVQSGLLSKIDLQSVYEGRPGLHLKRLLRSVHQANLT
jgi:hypothetical protein